MIRWSEIVDFELSIWGAFLTHPRFWTHPSFSGAMPNSEMYTDAFDGAPMENDVAKWDSATGLGGVLVINGVGLEYFVP